MCEVGNGSHGNSLDNGRPSHRYVIVGKDDGKLLKTGVSSSPLNLDGSSRRANSQLKLAEKLHGGPVRAVVVESGVSRRQVIANELRVVDKHFARQGRMPLMMKRPRPTGGGGGKPVILQNLRPFDM